MREVTGSSPVVSTKKSAPLSWGVLFLSVSAYNSVTGEKNVIVAGEFFISTAKNVDERKRFRYNNKCYGVIAQLVARLNGIQKVRGSTPLSSTTKKGRLIAVLFFSWDKG